MSADSAAVQTIVADNLDLGCSMIEKTAMDKAVREIDDHLMNSYTVGLPPCSSLLDRKGQHGGPANHV